MVEQAAAGGRCPKRVSASGLTAARLAYYYGIDPFDTPEWKLRVYATHLDAILAEQNVYLLGAIGAVWAKPADRRRALKRMLRLATPPPPPPPPATERDPEKAAAWFAARGARVIKS